ncbi:MAG TPA: VWA domain-containing protein [Urbifossiella sp.]|nr:VWA domain-containing protein [Urbifossiella sp.]
MTNPLLAIISPGLAIGAAIGALAAPLLIHLLFRKRYQIVPWAAIRFLLTAERRHRRRIDQWLLLALRTVALLLPLFAMIAATAWAEPLWQWFKPGKLESTSTAPRTHHVLVIDGSLSMMARTEGGRSRFERAVAQAEELIKNGNAGDGYSVVAITGTPRVIVPGPSNAHDKVLKELAKLKGSHAAADTAPALPLIADALSRSPRSYPRRQVTFFTDLQRSAWASALPRPDSATPDAWTHILKGKDGKGSADVVIVDVAKADVDNLAVADLALADSLPFVEAPAAVTATVQNHGASERRLVRLELLLARPTASGLDSLVSVETKVLDAVPAGGRASATFNLEGPRSGFLTRGIHVVQVKLVEGDDSPADDVRSLAVEVRGGLHAMIVDGKKGEADRLRRASEHLARALVPPGATRIESPARLHRPGAKRPTTPEERWILSPTEFANPDLGDPAGAECIFLCDLPAVTPAMVAKLESHLKRGGGVVIGLGPNAAAARDAYNKLLYADGDGLLPGPLGEVATAAADDPGFRLFAEEAEFRKPPLLAFRDDNARAGLATVPFRSYMKMDAPADGRARRILSFVPATGGAPANAGGSSERKPDPAVVEWARHRGRVVVYTSTFNQDWTDWPVLPSFLPFVHETLRFASANPDRHTIRVGEALEEFFPPSAAGLSAGLTGPDGVTATLPIVLRDEAGAVRFADTNFSGLYRLGIGDARDRSFAVNPPETSPSGGNEFDLRRAEPAEFKAVGPVQIVGDLSEVHFTGGSGTTIVSAPRPHGPTLARWAILIATLLLVFEVVLAWRLGPSRAPGVAARPVERHPFLRFFGNVAAFVLVLVVAAVIAVAFSAYSTGNLFGALPWESRHWAEDAARQFVGLPPTPPGENDRLVLEPTPALARDIGTDWLIAGAIAIGCLGIALGMYLRERGAGGGLRRIILPAALRCGVFLLALFIVLAQWQVTFKREGWPEIVILMDTSASMATVDDLRDPAVRAKAEQLAGAADLPSTHRLKLAQLLLTRPDGDWLEKLLREKRVKVHIYAVDAETRLTASATDEKDIDAARAALRALKPEGEASRLGDGVDAVIKAYQGGALAAIILFTDGVTTTGTDLADAAKAANVPLYLVGMGDPWVIPDVRLSDPIYEEVVARGDPLDLQARLSSRGEVPPNSIPVVLYEKRDDRLIERGRTTGVPTEEGAGIKISFTPNEVGDKIIVLETPPMPGEADAANNRIERRITVVDAKRSRVLFVEGDPRYDFRYAKVLMERESERVAGNKSIELKTVLLGASRGWAETDKSALTDFPTRDQLFEYDVVILGDFDPKALPRSSRAMQDLADFVRVKGGGILFAAGEHFNPFAFAETPLAEVLPIVPQEGKPPKPTPEATPLADPYHPQLTPAGRSHPLFRFSPDPAESERIWSGLKPLYWYAKSYRRKPAAEVLAVHKDRPAEGGGHDNHPLVLQQFVGAGRSLFIGFDETWRWRWRKDEEQFNKFWLQAVRVLARARRGKIELKLKDGSGPYRRDDRITVKVRFPDDAPAPPAGAAVRVQVQRSPLPNPDGSPGAGDLETQILVLSRVKSERAEFEGVLTRTPVARYRFTLVEPDGGANPTRAEAAVLPPPTERERLDMNRPGLAAAASYSHGGFYTLATADKLFADLHNLEPIELNEPLPPLPLWNHGAVYGLFFAVLLAEWLLRKRERLL